MIIAQRPGHVNSFLKKNSSHKVLKVISQNEFYIDFNDNKIADTEELVILDDIDIEPAKINKIDNAGLNYLASQFAQNVLLNKNVFYLYRITNFLLCFI